MQGVLFSLRFSPIDQPGYLKLTRGGMATNYPHMKLTTLSKGNFCNICIRENHYSLAKYLMYFLMYFLLYEAMSSGSKIGSHIMTYPGLDRFHMKNKVIIVQAMRVLLGSITIEWEEKPTGDPCCNIHICSINRLWLCPGRSGAW